jgi:hypothetical protein
MRMKKRHEQKLLVLSLALWLLLNLPLLLLFDAAEPWLGIPQIYWYIFSIWTFSIVVTLSVIRKYAS